MSADLIVYLSGALVTAVALIVVGRHSRMGGLGDGPMSDGILLVVLTAVWPLVAGAGVLWYIGRVAFPG